jgi:hypothetical protein
MRSCTGILLLVLPLPGCSPIPPHPEGLPPLAAAGVPVERCIEIAGHYRDAGSAISGSGASLGSASLTRILHLNKSSFAADVVVLRGPRNDVLEVESFRGNTSVALLKKQLIKEIHEKYRSLGFACTDGFVPFHIEMSSGSLAPVPVGGFAGNEIWLRRAADGSLVVVDVHSGGGVVGVIPWGSSQNTWYSFPPAE